MNKRKIDRQETLYGKYGDAVKVLYDSERGWVVWTKTAGMDEWEDQDTGYWKKESAMAEARWWLRCQEE